MDIRGRLFCDMYSQDMSLSFQRHKDEVVNGKANTYRNGRKV